MTIGTYEVPIWGKQGWLVPLDDLPASYDVDDLLPAIRGGLTVDGQLYAAPFYGESSMVMYRKDLMEKAGLTMPDAPTWDRHQEGRRGDDRQGRTSIYGICLRGKAGWGENMAFLTAMSNSFGAQVVRHGLEPAVRQRALGRHADLLPRPDEQLRSSRRLEQRLQREPGAVPAGQVRHVDRRHRRRLVRDRPKDSTVADKVGFALAPDNGLGKRGNWLWAWSLAIPAGSPEGRCRQDLHRLGDLEGLHSRWSPRKKAGPTFLRAPAPRSTRTRNTRRCRSPR